MNLVDLLIRYQKIRKKYIDNYEYYFNLIKQRAINLLGPETKVYLFGSFLTKKFGPNSDIDLLIVSSQINPNDHFQTAKIKIELEKDFESGHPFELHLTNSEQFNNWYKRFIKEDIKEL